MLFGRYDAKARLFCQKSFDPVTGLECSYGKDFVLGYRDLHTYLIDHSPLGLVRANETNNWNEQVKWQEADQLDMYKRSRGVEPGTTSNKPS